jgi:putative transposase
LTIRGPEDYNGAGDPNTLITPHLQYLGLSANGEEPLNNYRGLIEEKFDEQELSAIRGATNRNYVVGNTRFQKEIEIALGRRTRPARPGRPNPM